MPTKFSRFLYCTMRIKKSTRFPRCLINRPHTKSLFKLARWHVVVDVVIKYQRGSGDGVGCR